MKLKEKIEKILYNYKELEHLDCEDDCANKFEEQSEFEDAIDKLTSLFLSTLSGLKAMEEEKQQSYNPDVNISQAGRNQLRQEILKELKAELKEI